MNESAARQVTLLQAFETAQPASPSWGDDDRNWANRVAIEAAGTTAAPDDFVAQRARHAMQRLAPRERAAERWLAQPSWRSRMVLVVVAIAFVIGVLADGIGPNQRVNLLAPPMWGVMLWNLVVYFGLIAAALAKALRRVPSQNENGIDTPLPAGPIVRMARTLLLIGQRLPKGGAWRQFGQLWASRSASLSMLRAETLLHAGAAALGLGLIGGLYARGLVLDFRAAWESTFLSADVAHAIVSAVLAPASALSNITLPDTTAFAALQSTHANAIAGAPAAPWIHLFAISLTLYVVLPRSLLALVCSARARRRSKRFPMSMNDPYFQRLVRMQRGGAAQVQVWPYAIRPSPQAVLGLRSVLAEGFGPKVGLQIAPAVAFGVEDSAPAASTSHAIAWFDMIATPEAESHGRFLRRLAVAVSAGAGVHVLIDEGAFKRRFEGMPERFAQRRDAWRRFCEELGTLPIFADLEAAEPAVAEADLQAALARPVQIAAVVGQRTGPGRCRWR